MWTSFRDLALAGGPSHRSTLLEAVPAGDALAEPEKYRAVVAEIERGITLVTGLPVVASKVPGWVGVRCDSEEMAVWLMRAIVVENVMVRREGDALYLPAGPRFTLKREIKNVVAVMAKTFHYWSAHIVAARSALRG
jgi:sirohydrochlorin cobaltochelatase